MSNNFLGMTVNERLYAAGLSDAFDQAVEQRNVSEIKHLLYQVELRESSIKQILVSLQLNDLGADT